MHQSRCVMNPCIFRAWGRILYASNVIFPISVWAFKSYFIHDTSCILPTSCRLPGAHVCTAAVLIKSWGQHRPACSTRQAHTHTHTPTQHLSADATLRAFIWSLQDVRKLKRFIGWCSNYHRPTVAFFCTGLWAEKWILNVLAFLHAHQPVVNYVPGKCFNNIFCRVYIMLHKKQWDE